MGLCLGAYVRHPESCIQLTAFWDPECGRLVSTLLRLLYSRDCAVVSLICLSSIDVYIVSAVYVSISAGCGGHLVWSVCLCDGGCLNLPLAHGMRVRDLSKSP